MFIHKSIKKEHQAGQQKKEGVSIVITERE